MSDDNSRKVPPFCNVGKHERMVDPSGLTVGQRQLLWSGIKAENPDLAEMLKTDANIEALKQRLGATFQLTVDDYGRYINAAQKKFEEKKSCINY